MIDEEEKGGEEEVGKKGKELKVSPNLHHCMNMSVSGEGKQGRKKGPKNHSK